MVSALSTEQKDKIAQKPKAKFRAQIKECSSVQYTRPLVLYGFRTSTLRAHAVETHADRKTGTRCVLCSMLERREGKMPLCGRKENIARLQDRYAGVPKEERTVSPQVEGANQVRRNTQ